MSTSSAPCSRSEEHTSEPSHMSISYAVFCLKKKKNQQLAGQQPKSTMVSQLPTNRSTSSRCGSYVLAPRTVHSSAAYLFAIFFFFNDTATTEIYTLSLHDALPISIPRGACLEGEATPLDLAPRV